MQYSAINDDDLRLKDWIRGRPHFPFTKSAAKQLSMHCAVRRNPLIQQVLRKYNYFSAFKEIVFCWLPSHINIRGNELDDLEAKSTSSLSIANLKNPHSDFKSSIHKYIMNKCQSILEKQTETIFTATFILKLQQARSNKNHQMSNWTHQTYPCLFIK